MSYSYEITPRPVELGGGWRLRLLEGNEEMGGGVFPIPEDDPQASITWWNNLSEVSRAHWLMIAASTQPADAYRAYELDEAYADAESTAYEWLDSRESA
jgi:hypothetical protein